MKWKVLLAIIATVSLPQLSIANEAHVDHESSTQAEVGPVLGILFGAMGFAFCALTAVGIGVCATEGECCCKEYSPSYEQVT